MSTELQRPISYVDIARQHAPLKAELLAAVARVLDHGGFILGPEVFEFERLFAGLVGTKYAIGVNSGTNALVLALRALGVGPGDEVITAVNSFVASASCIAMVGARPVLVDVRDDYNLDPAGVEAAVTSRTKAILPVHLTGRPAEMDTLCAIARRHKVFMVEDAAQAVAATYRNQPVGSFGDVGCFSLHPLKTLNACGDGGVAVTQNAGLAGELQIMRNLGLATRENAKVWSNNSRLDTIQAAMLLVKLNYLAEWTEKRRANARFYQQHLAGVAVVQVPQDAPEMRSVYHTFVIQAERRDELQKHLADRGIGSQIHYPQPIHLQAAAAPLGYRLGDFPVAERQARRILSLPIYPDLREADLARIAGAIRQFYGI